jgi:hypothetical protein
VAVSPPYPSALLFHGPGASPRALAESHRLGKFLLSAGAEGLKVSEARDVVDAINNPPPSDLPQVILIGPMDRCTHAASDALLKSLEEFDTERVRPVLWANDLFEVLPTVRSRCHFQWCPDTTSLNEDLEAKAKLLVEASLQGDYASVIETVRDSELEDLLLAVPEVLMKISFTPQIVNLWENIRQLTSRPFPTKTEFLSALI